jgi:hypothetical protein
VHRNAYLRQMTISIMADSIMSYAIAAGIFALLVAVLFGTRTKRIWASRKEVPGKDSKFTHSEAA